MFRQFVFPAVAVFLCFASHAESQTSPSDVRRAIQDVINEKLKIPPDVLQEYLKTGRVGAQESIPAEALRRKAFPAVDERVISGDALPESEVHAAVNPTNPNNIVVSPIRFDQRNFREVLLCPIFVTTNFGQTWTKSAFKTLPNQTGGIVAGGGDPVFTFDADGKLYFSWIDLYALPPTQIFMAIFWAWSSDGGVTWKQEANPVIGQVAFASPMSATEAYDKQWLAADRTNSPWRNTLYAAFFHPDSARGLRIELRHKRADSSGFTMASTPVSTPDFKFVQFSSIGVDPVGGVHVTFFGSKDSVVFSMYHAMSSDGGVSFSLPAKISDVNIPRFSANDRLGTVPGILNERLYPCPHMVIDHSAKPSRGFLYVVWSGNGIDRKDANGMDVFFSRSTDNGATWSPPLIVNDDTKGVVRDQFHPSIAVNDRGIISVIWYDRREDAMNASAKLYYAQSANGGIGFSRNITVASVAMDVTLCGQDNGGFGVGEYNQVVMTDDTIIPFWSDGRDNDGNLDIFAAFIPIADLSSATRVGTVSEDFALETCYPNPVRNTASIRYSIAKPSRIRIELTDLLGRTIRRLIDDERPAGRHTVEFDAETLAAGDYSCTLFTDFGFRVIRISVIR